MQRADLAFREIKVKAGFIEPMLLLRASDLPDDGA
jgi:hypothetical protein